MKALVISRFVALSAIAILQGCGGSAPSGSDGGRVATLKLKILATGMASPMQYKSNPVDGELAYVLERAGRIRLFRKDLLQRRPVLDIASLVTTSGEGGLLGMAFDARFANNRHIYLHYSNGTGVTTVIARYTMDPSMTSIDTSSARTIIRITQPFTNHKGGSINFGQDGFLYVGMGDGGSGNDPSNNAQNPNSLLGKMLRIDPTGDDFPADPLTNYSIPTSNPWFSTAGARKELWAIGVRNPFRWNIDSVTGALLIADVGQGTMEEVNYEPAGMSGRNYGWRVREGTGATGLSGNAFNTTYRNPFFTYLRNSTTGGFSITGGFFYRGTALAELTNRYLCADYVSNNFWAVPIVLNGSGEANTTPLASAARHPFAVTVSGIVSIDPDATGEPILVELNNNRVSRIVP